MKGLETIILAGMIGCAGQDSTPIDTSTYDTGDADTDTDTDTDTQTYNAPQITSSLNETAYVDQQFTYTLTATQDSTHTGGTLNCTFNAPFDFVQNDCKITYTPTSIDLDLSSYNVDMEVSDENGKDDATLELMIVDDSSGTITLGTFSDLSGYTNETLSGTGNYSGDAASANISLDSSLDAVVSNATASLSGSNVNYNVIFNNDIDWNSYSTGYVSGTATISVCDKNDACQSKNISVSGYAPTEILITAQTADDKNPLSTATIYVDCDSGESYEPTLNADGEATAYLNNSDDVCMITSDAGSAYAVYSWEHDIGSASEDLVSDGYYEVWAEVYDNFTPSATEPEYATCYSGRLSSSRNLLMYAGELLSTVDGSDSGTRDFLRFSKDELSSPIQYWVSTTKTDGSTTDSLVYDNMYAAIVEATDIFNTTNPTRTTYFQEATSITDANIIFYYDNTWTSSECSYSSSDIIGNYATGDYCRIRLHAYYEEARTSMAEITNTISLIDLCGNSITDGGNELTIIDWFIWDTINLAKYQNLMERTY